MFNLKGTMVIWAILSLWLVLAHGMRDSRVNELRYDFSRCIEYYDANSM